MCTSGKLRATVGILSAVVLLAGAATPAVAAAAPISPQARTAIIEAVNAEYKAIAMYKAIALRHKDTRPFSNWAQSDRSDELKALFPKYGVALPADTFAGKAQAPSSVAEACKAANQIETGLVAMYERLLKTVKEADIVAVFTDLRDGSKRRVGALGRHCN